MRKMRRSRAFKKERENNVIDIDDARKQRRKKRKEEKEKREEKQAKSEKAIASQRRRARGYRRRLIYFLIFALIVGVVTYTVWMKLLDFFMICKNNTTQRAKYEARAQLLTGSD